MIALFGWHFLSLPASASRVRWKQQQGKAAPLAEAMPRVVSAKSSTEPFTEGPACWICLDDHPSELIQPCSCPRHAHRKCLARWQLQKSGSLCVPLGPPSFACVPAVRAPSVASLSRVRQFARGPLAQPPRSRRARLRNALKRVYCFDECALSVTWCRCAAYGVLAIAGSRSHRARSKATNPATVRATTHKGFSVC